MKRLALLLLVACGDPEVDRVCLHTPCLVPGHASQECLDYVACLTRQSSSNASVDQTYGNGGVCWTQGEATADSCTTACRAALISLRSSSPGC